MRRSLKMNYEVRDTDTLEGIAAAHDCTVGELVKMNKMHSRMVFPGQKMIVPPLKDDDVFISEKDPKDKDPEPPKPNAPAARIPHHLKSTVRSQSVKENCSADGIRKGPGSAVPVQLTQARPAALANNHTLQQLSKTQSVPVGNSTLTSEPSMAAELDPEDKECLQRFLKIRVKQVTESDGTVTGTLLVTPNCLMFDPDVHHPLVKENGSDLYGMVANMDEIASVSVYKTIGGATGERNKKEDIFDPEYIRTKKPSENGDDKAAPEIEEKTEGPDVAVDGGGESAVKFIGGCLEDDPQSEENNLKRQRLSLGNSGGSSLSGSDQGLPCIHEEDPTKGTPVVEQKTPSNELGVQPGGVKRRSVSDVTPEQKTPIEEVIAEFSDDAAQSSPLQPSSATDRPRAHSDLEPSTSLDPNSGKGRSTSPSAFSRYSPNMARRSFGRLGRTLSARAGSVKRGVAVAGQTVASGTQKVAHGVVTHTKSAADHIQTGIQTSAKVVASVPGSIVNVGAGLIQEGQSGVLEVYDSLFSSGEESQERSPQSMKRERSMATLESLRQKTEQARELSAHSKEILFSSAFTSEEMPSLVRTVGDLTQDQNSPIGTPPDPPYYMTVRLDRRTKKKKRQRQPLTSTPQNSVTSSVSSSFASYEEEGSAFGNKRKREFWYAVPRVHVDAVYHFLLQWRPDKYGKDTTTATIEDASSGSRSFLDGSGKGFIVLDSDADESLAGEKPSAQPFGSGNDLNREWEIVTVREMCRRLSLEDSFEPSELPLPEGATQSQILDEYMIRQILDVLPPRAEGYPWVNIYNSEKHGFSLATLYRKMSEWKEEMSPILLIVRDVNGHVFGAIASTALRPAEHYYGTGDSCLLFRFTGEYPHTRELRTFTWTGDNQFFVNATKDFFSMGAGGGHSGLWLDADLNHGRSQKCATFDNEPLAGGEKEDFVIQFVEAFGFSMS